MIEATKLEADIYPAGPRGLSAYEIYKKEGGQLSEEEWLKSLNGLTPTIGENGNWFLGTVDTGLPSRGPKGDTGSIKFIVVTELPTENIDETAIYMKPVESPTGENKFEELIYVNGKWEDLGTPNVAVDLSDYYTKEEIDSTKQNILIPGENITIENNVISAATSLPIYYIDIDEPLIIDASAGGLHNTQTTDVCDKMSDIINNARTKGYHEILIMMNFTNNSYLFKTSNNKIQTGHNERVARIFGGDILFPKYNYKSRTILTLDGSWVNDVFTCKTINWRILGGDYISTNNEIEYTPTGDYNPATKKYVDDVITDNISRFIPCYSLLSTDNLKLQYFSENAKELKSTYTEIGNAINDAYTKGYKKLMLHFYTNDDSNGYNNITFTSMNVDLQNQPTLIRYQDVLMNTEFVSTSFQSLRLDIYGTWTDNIFTVNSALLRGRTNKFPSQNEVLTKTNTTSYTPTKDYNPATKKYVDDQVGNINTVLATLTTVSEVTK